METTILKCPGCNSPLPYNAEKRLWKCEFCGSEYSREQILQMTQQKSDSDIDKPYQEPVEPPHITTDDGQSPAESDAYGQPELNIYRCQNCGAEMVADANTAATFCVYCGSAGIIKNRLEGQFRPKYIIPFLKTKEDAIAGYNKLREGRFLAPKEFGDPSNIEKITGVYIPFWLYDGVSQGSVDGDRDETSSWRSGDYVYTKHNIYHEHRAGHQSFEKVPADGSEKFDDDLMDSIEPFDFGKLEPFNYSYLSGFLAEKYDVDAEKDKERATLRMNNSLIQSLDNTIHGGIYDRKEFVKCNISKYEYALLPVWMLNTFVDGKAHTFAMNGESGKMTGDVPIDGTKAFWFFIALVGGLCGLGALIAKLFFM